MVNGIIRLNRKTLNHKKLKLFCDSHLSKQARSNTDNFVIGYFISASAVTHYFIGFRLVEYATKLLGAATSSMMMPVFTRFVAQNRKHELEQKTQFITRFNLSLALSVTMTLVFIGDDFIHRWMGPEFTDSYKILVILLTGNLVMYTTSALNSGLYASNKHKINALFGIAEVIINLILSIALVQSMGILGAAIGTFIPLVLFRLFIYPFYALKALSMSPAKYYSSFIRPLAVFCVPMFLAAFMTKRILLTNYIDILTSALILGLVSLACTLTALTATERGYIINTLKNFRK